MSRSAMASMYILLVWVSTVSIQAQYQLYNNGTGVCKYWGSGYIEYVTLPDDLESVKRCGTCGDIFAVTSSQPCEVEPCDGFVCFDDEYRIAHKSRSQCGYQGDLMDNCDQCDTPCLQLCKMYQPVNTVPETDFVECAFGMTGIGTAFNGLCSGSVPSGFCDNAEAENRTCYIARILDDDIAPDPSLVFSECAPVFRRVYDKYDYWACPMDAPVSGLVNIFKTTMCDIFEASYGQPMEDGYGGEPSAGDKSSAKSAGSKLFLPALHL